MKFSTKLTTVLSVLVAFTNVLFLLLFIELYQKKSIENIYRQEETFSRNVRDHIVDIFIADDMMKLNEEIRMFQEAMDQVAYIFVTGNNGKLLAHTFKNGFPQEIFNSTALPAGKMIFSRLLSTEEGRIRDFALRIAENMPGTVHVGINQEFYNKQIKNVVNIIIYTLLISLTLGTLLVYFFSRRLTAFLPKLGFGMEKICSGNPDYRLEERGDSEVLHLIRSYNKMADSISEEMTKRQEAIAKISHLNNVFHAIRKVNQLITMEKDRARLLKGICDILIESRGYHNAWVALFDKSGKLTFAAEAGLMEPFASMIEQLQRGKLPLCYKKSLKTRDAVIIEDPYTTCAHCPLAQYHHGRAAAMSTRLGKQSTVYGILTVSVSKVLVADPEELQLFEEVAEDIALALHALDQEEKRTRAESVLKEERDRSQMYLNIAGNIFLALNSKGTITMINKKGCAVLGYSNKELIGKNWFDICIPERMKKKSEEVFHTLLYGDIEPVEYFENPILTKSGEERIILWHNSIIKDKSGKPAGTLSAGEDITELIQAEEAFHHEQDLLKSLMDTVPDIIYFKDKESRFITVNTAAAELFGIEDPSKIAGLTNFDFFNEDYGRLMIKEEQEIMRSEKPIIAKKELKKFKNGREMWVSTTRMPLRDRQGHIIGTFSISRDITKQKEIEDALKRSEEQLLQAQKMEAIGRLAGGVAHDFNNLLTVILGYSNMLLLEPELNTNQLEYVSEIKKAGDRAASLTQQLLAFSRKQILQPEILNINKVINGLKKMLRRLLSEDITLKIKPSSHLPTIKADPHQLTQVIMNLVINASDAVSYGGSITIETKQVDLDESACRQYSETKPGTYCVFTIRDNGQGMDEETKRHIFEPFFTTKEEGKGTGLGLSTVFGIVKQSGGFIDVTSEVQKGTTFQIFLPAQGKAYKKREIPLKKAETHRGNATILVVEDDKMLREMIIKSLKKIGYTILQAKNGEEAFRICENFNRKKIHLLITDVIMPGMHGMSLADKFKMIYPDILILFISGYIENELWWHRIQKEGLPFLQKPFTPNILAEKVRELLAE